MIHRLSALLLLAPAFVAASFASAQSEGVPDFDREVRPILASKCFTCHGPDAAQRKAKLRLDTQRGAFAERERRTIVRGDANASELVRRIRSTDPKRRMPPPGSGHELEDAERRVLERWIENGAPWAEHWAFVPPSEVAVPPAVGGSALTAIDRFVRAKLVERGLEASPEADRRTLARRVSLDLTGLPPSLEDVRAFDRDPTANAYERFVDRLLASPRFGEHMARYWLDVARYGDTHGLHLDNYREMWLYRDWVVQAFNANMPFDRFVVEQVAGDMLPGASDAQRIASGFNRCHVTTAEGGSIREEVYVRNVVDRVSTTATAFMGLTAGCAVCHDHKFDPLTQREFYQLFAFFNNFDQNPLDGNKKDHAPSLRVELPEQTARKRALNAQIRSIEDEVAAELRKVRYEEVSPEPDVRAREASLWIDDALPEGAVPRGLAGAWIRDVRANVRSGDRALETKAAAFGQHVFENARTKLRIGAGDRLFAWVWIDPRAPAREIMLQWNSEGNGSGWKHRIYWGENLVDFGRDGSSERVRGGALPKPGAWHKLEVPVEKVGLRAGMVVHGMAFTQHGGRVLWDEVGIVSATRQAAEDFVWIDDAPPPGAKLAGNGAIWQWSDASRGAPVFSGTRSLRRSGRALIQDFFTGAKPLVVREGDRLFAHVWIDPKDPPSSVQLQWHDKRGWGHRARWGGPAHGPGAKGGADHVAGKLPPTGKWVRLEVPVAAVGLRAGDRVSGQAFTQVGGTVYWDCAGVHTWQPPDERYRVSQLAWEQMAAGDKAVPADVRKAIAIATKKRSADASARVRAYYLRHVFAGTRKLVAPFDRRIEPMRAELAAIERAIPTTLIARERAKPRDAFVLLRGAYDQRGEKVARRTPSFLPPMAEGMPRDRLGFARWLVAPEHPLTARVAVNRFWQQLFGTGLVKTSEDFGNQGERPSHPNLLDFLARRFVQSGWDVKALVKRMVLSATYRQSSVHTPSARLDPENRWLARGPRFRLDAEALRDQALALGDVLVEKVGGPGVKPPQPAGLWFAVAYTSSNTARFKADASADKIFRRSLYTFWKRTSPPPQMSTLDAPSREACVVRRERTNTPLQALLLMNDPQYVEAARHFAARILREGGSRDRERIVWAFEVATARVPAEQDVQDLLRLLAQQRDDFARRAGSARALRDGGFVKPKSDAPQAVFAAWTMVASVLLNLDEVLNKE